MVYKLATSCLALALALVLGAGCSSSKTPAKNGKQNPKQEAEEAPHGGTLFATPDHNYHLELKMEKGKPAILYVLAKNAADSVPMAARSLVLKVKGDKAVNIEFLPDRQKKDPEGEASQFTAPADKMPENLNLEKVEISTEVKKGTETIPYHFKLDKE
jgi:hypothetical protein